MFAIKMPKGGQTTDESLIARWNKKVGDPVKRGDSLLSIETDKATLEVESYCEGYLRAALYKENEPVSAGEIVAYVGQMDESLPEEAVTVTQPPEDDDEYSPIMPPVNAKGKSQTGGTKAAPERIAGEVPAGWVSGKKAPASPKAKRAARELGIPLENTEPTRNGIVKYADVMRKCAEAGEGRPGTEDGRYRLIPLTSMRAAIARRMSESSREIPQYTVTVEIDMENAIRLRKILNSEMGGSRRIAYHDILAKCAAVASAEYPYVNATFTEEGIRLYNRVNIGLAVALEQGLVVPVVRDVERRSISSIAAENSRNIAKAKEGSLAAEDMTGGTITISNLGMYGAVCFTALINPPESCILAMGAIAEKPMKVEGETVFRNTMTLTASFDHRLIDGAVGACFLSRVKKLMECPEMLLL